MFGLSWTTWIALAVVGIGALFLLTPLGRRKKKVEKWEKAEIMRKLLALSDQEAGAKQPGAAARARASSSRPAVRPSPRPGQMLVKANAKTTLPPRSKTR